MNSEKGSDPGSVRVTPENSALVLELCREFYDSAKEQAQEERSKADTAFVVTQQRIGFLEKLIVVDGGTFALSLTLLSALSSHIHHPVPPGLNLGWLYGAWILLLLSIALSWIHNNLLHSCGAALHVAAMATVDSRRLFTLQRQTRRFSELVSGSVQRDGELKDMSQVFTDLANSAEEMRLSEGKKQLDLVNQAKRYERISIRLGAGAVWATWIAFLLILIFAMRTGWVLLLPG